MENTQTITCPHCNKKLNIPENRNGNNYECDWCEHWIDIKIDKNENIICTAMFEPEVYLART